MKKHKVTINPDYFGPGDGLYVIHFDGGCSTLGFDRVMELGNLLAAELDRWDLTPLPAERGTMKAYGKYRKLSDLVFQKHKESGFRSRVDSHRNSSALKGRESRWWTIAAGNVASGSANRQAGYRATLRSPPGGHQEARLSLERRLSQ